MQTFFKKEKVWEARSIQEGVGSGVCRGDGKEQDDPIMGDAPSGRGVGRPCLLYYCSFSCLHMLHTLFFECMTFHNTFKKTKNESKAITRPPIFFHLTTVEIKAQ